MTFAWARRPGVLKAARIGGYVLFVFLVFLVSAVLTFPTGRLRSYLESRLSQGGYVVRMGDLSLRGLASAALTEVHVELPPDRATTPDGQVTLTKRSWDLDRVDVSIGLFRALLGDLSLTVRLEDGEGTFGPVKVLKTKEKVSVDLAEVKDFPFPSDLPIFGVKFAGVLTSGKGAMTYDLKGGLAASTGRLELAARGIKALKPTLRSEAQGSVTLTDADMGTLALEVNLDKRSNLSAFKAERKAAGADATVVHFEKAELDGADIKALIEGHSTLRLTPGKGISDAQMAVEAAFSLSDPFFDRQVKGAGEVQTPNKFLRTLLSMDPRWKAAQSGTYWGITCTGMLGHPSCVPKKPSIRGGDFKPPAKDEEKPTAKEGAKPAAKPASAAPSSPAPAVTVTPPPPTNPAALSAPAPAPVPATPPSPPARQDEEEDPQAKAAMNTLLDAINKPKTVPSSTLTPTVIGRSRVRAVMRAGGEEEEAPGPTGNPPAEGQAQPPQE